MLKMIKPLSITLAVVILLLGFAVFAGAGQADAAGQAEGAPSQEAQAPGEPEDEQEKAAAPAGSDTSGKAMAAALAIGMAAIGGTLGMGIAIFKSADGVARQPEAGGQIQTQLMLGLVFIETVVIYALIVTILIIFVM